MTGKINSETPWYPLPCTQYQATSACIKEHIDPQEKLLSDGIGGFLHPNVLYCKITKREGDEIQVTLRYHHWWKEKFPVAFDEGFLDFEIKPPPLLEQKKFSFMDRTVVLKSEKELSPADLHKRLEPLLLKTLEAEMQYSVWDTYAHIPLLQDAFYKRKIFHREGFFTPIGLSKTSMTLKRGNRAVHLNRKDFEKVTSPLTNSTSSRHFKLLTILKSKLTPFSPDLAAIIASYSTDPTEDLFDQLERIEETDYPSEKEFDETIKQIEEIIKNK